MMAIKTVVAGALGEGLEIYDFLVFTFFAIYISRAFFPQQGPTQSLLLTVATLGLGFVTRHCASSILECTRPLRTEEGAYPHHVVDGRRDRGNCAVAVL